MLRAPPLVALPAAFLLAPMVTVAIPAMRRPRVSMARRFPVTRHPSVVPARPVPIAADPDLADDRRPANILDPRRRRRHDDRFAVVVTIIGVRPIGGNDRTTTRDCSSRQQDPQDSVFHSRAFRYCDKIGAINVGIPEQPTRPAVLYKLLQFSANAPVSDEHLDFDANYPGLLRRMRTGGKKSN